MMNKQEYTNWNDEQIELLKKHYENTPNSELLMMFFELGYIRTSASVDSKAHKLGIKKNKVVKHKAISDSLRTSEKFKIARKPKDTIICNRCVYWYMPQYFEKHPDKVNKKSPYVQARRIILEKHIGRLLQDDEGVIHIDGDYRNLDVNNLKIIPSKRLDVKPIDVYIDKMVKGLSVLDIREKYNISINTYYRKLEKGADEYYKQKGK